MCGGERWEVAVSGARTQSTKDEFGLRFVRITGGPREERVARYTPLGSKARESLARARSGDAELARPADALAAGLDRARDRGTTADRHR